MSADNTGDSVEANASLVAVAIGPGLDVVSFDFCVPLGHPNLAEPSAQPWLDWVDEVREIGW